MSWGSDAPNMDGANEAAVGQLNLAKEQWGTWKEEFMPVVLDQMQQQIDVGKNTYKLAREQQDWQLGLARQYNDRYWGVQVPLEDQIIDEARDFDTEAERERMAGEARGDVSQAFGMQKSQLRRDMGRMGLNPSDPKYFAMTRAMATDEALATANAMNKTREAAKQLGWSKRMDASALARGLPGFSGGSSSAAMGWGGYGLQGAGMGMNAAGQGAGIMNQTASSAGQNFAGAGQTYTNIAGIQQKADAANMEMLGTLAGAGSKMMMMSDRRLKTDVRRVGEMRNGIPLYSFRYKSGGPTMIGVMADEVMQVMPSAVALMPSGYYAVDYAMLEG